MSKISMFGLDTNQEMRLLKKAISTLSSIPQKAYHLARLLAAKETNLAEETFYPEHYPFTWGQVINLNYYPK
jgi:hypothetical protein